jgi:lysophospholipase L1-like esterase
MRTAPHRLAVVGDSIAWGMGAARPQERLAPRLVDGLAAAGIEAEARVFAVPGARSTGLLPQVDQARQWGPDATVIVIGANDLTHLEPLEPAVAALEQAIEQLNRIGSRVVLAPAPDLSMVPHVPPVARPLVRAMSLDYRRRQVALADRLGARVADADGETAARFTAEPAVMFSADRFHPSSAGYAVIAEVVLPELLASFGVRAAG